jgi:TonB family protein
VIVMRTLLVRWRFVMTTSIRERLGRVLWAALIVCGSVAIGAQSGFLGARYATGDLPETPVRAVSGGEVFLEVAVDTNGHVATINTLRATPPFTEEMRHAIGGWQFEPAQKVGASSPGPRGVPIQPVDATVLVAGMFRPPTMNTPTLGEPPRDVGAPSELTPFPIATTNASYPPRARGDGTVLVDVTIDARGVVTDAQVVRSSPAFDAAAVAAARSWSFRPARLRGEPVTTHVYLLFAFREPVIGR